MYTLEISNGDLVLDGGRFATVSGSDKIQQDLAIGLLTEYGSDRFHPRYGSILNTFIGQPSSAITETQISSEVNRVVTNYMAVQASVVNTATLQGQQSPYNQNDLVASIDSIDATTSLDTCGLDISLTTLAGEQIEISAAMTPSSNSVSGL